MKVYANSLPHSSELVPERSGRAITGIRAGHPLEVDLPEGSTLADLVDFTWLYQRQSEDRLPWTAEQESLTIVWLPETR